MKTRAYLFILLFVFVFSSCKAESKFKSVDKDGGLVISISAPNGFMADETSDSIQGKLKKRFDIVYPDADTHVSYEGDKNRFVIELPAVKQIDFIPILVEAHGNIQITESVNWADLFDEMKDTTLIAENDTLKLINFDSEHAYYGVASICDTAKINTFFASERIRNLLPDNSYTFHWGIPYNDDPCAYTPLYWSRNSSKNILLSETYEQTSVEEDSRYYQNYLHVKLKKGFAKKIEQLTEDNVGNILLIILDRTVITAPMVMSRIEGGNMTIAGKYTEQELLGFKALIESGIIKTNLKIEELKEYPKPTN